MHVISRVLSKPAFGREGLPYNLIVEVEAEDIRTLSRIIINKVREVDGVTGTMTMVVVPD